MTGLKKQKLLLGYIISSPDVYAMCSPILEPSYFDPDVRGAVEFIGDYYEQYHSIPDTEQIIAETDVELEYQQLTRDKVDYCAKEIEQFCKERAIMQAIRLLPKLAEKEDYGAMKQVMENAVTVSLKKDLGINFWDAVKERLEERLEDVVYYSTGYDQVDLEMGGGLERKTITVISANSGGGKSITMANIAKNLLEQKLNVLYLSLELYKGQVDDRFIQMFTAIAKREFKGRVNEIGELIEMVKRKADWGDLTIQYMPSGTNANDIKSYLKTFELQNKYVPDVICIDYLDLMGTNQHVDFSDTFVKDKYASEQLKDLLIEYNAIGITASQQNRDGVGQTELNHSHVAGGISKVNTSDTWISVIMTDTMRAKGEITFQFLKTRHGEGCGKYIYLKWDRKNMNILNPEEDGLTFNPKQPEEVPTAKTKTLIDLLENT